jgi:hypothetical protein
MRRFIAPVVLGLGVFLLLTAALLRFYAAPALVKIPLEQNVTSVSEATGATYLDLASLTIKTGQHIRATREIRSDVAASSADHVVFDAFVRVENVEDDGLVSGTTDRVALDRRDAHAVDCCDEAVDSKPTAHSGLSYTFPIGTERKTYRFFDTTVKKAFPIQYKDTEDVEGHATYRFEQEISEQPLGEMGAPGSLVGQPNQLTVQTQQLYSNVRTVWVEPTTGAILKGQEQQLRVLRTPDGADTTVFEATIGFTPEAVDQAVARTENSQAQARLVTVTGPFAGLVLGLLLTAAGAVLMWRRRAAGRRRADEYDDYAAEEPTTV